MTKTHTVYLSPAQVLRLKDLGFLGETPISIMQADLLDGNDFAGWIVVTKMEPEGENVRLDRQGNVQAWAPGA